MKTQFLPRLIIPSLVLFASTLAMQSAGAQAPAAAPTTCKDGTTSSATGRGACSGHGGVQKASSSTSSSSSSSAPAATPPASSTTSSSAATKATAPTTTAPSTAAPSSSTAAKSTASTTKSTTGNTDPTGATAKCKDGTYSKSKHHSGTCSKHGGVDTWMDGTSK